MIPTVIVLLISTFVRPGRTQDACDAPEPLLIPISNISISDAGVEKWGVSLDVGTPPQTLVPSINADWNSTSLWGPILGCKDTPRPACSWNRGGSFDPSESSTFANTTDDSTVTTEYRSSDHSDLGISPWGTDTVSLGPDATVEDFPIYSSSAGGTVPQNALALGPNSTFLDMLVKQGKIASRTWSLFWGRQGEEEDHQMKGSLVLGGYDKAKTEDRKNTTIDFGSNSECPSSLLVSITDITMNRVTGEHEELMKDLGSTMQSCIKPDYRLMTFPKSVYDKFEDLLPGNHSQAPSGLYDSAMSYPRKVAFAGNITIKLDTGFSLTIPNHQLVRPNIGIAEDSNDQTRLDNNDTVMVYRRGVSDMPLLGQVFLSAAYLYVNNEQRKFTLWEANPQSHTQLVTVDSSSNSEWKDPSTCDRSGSPNADSGGHSTRPTSSNALSSGAIAGIAVAASIAGLALIALLAFFLWRRHKRNQKGKVLETHAAALHAVDTKTGSSPSPDGPQQHQHQHEPQARGMGELDGGQGYQVLPEMNVREASATAELPADEAYTTVSPEPNSAAGSGPKSPVSR